MPKKLNLEIDTFDTIEIIAELFNLYDFSVEFSRSLDVFYDAPEKKVYMTYHASGEQSILILAHEIMHHKQNVEGRLLKGDDENDYITARALAAQVECLQWATRTFPVESEAYAFSKLFYDKLAQFWFAENYITKKEYERSKELSEELTKIEGFAFEEDAERMMVQEKVEYERLDKEFGDRLIEIIRKRIKETPPNERRQKVKITERP